MPKRILVGVNEQSRRVGEGHQGARFTDHDIELIIELHEGGMTYREIAVKMECSFDHIRSICLGRRRGQRPVRWKGVVLATVPGVKAGRRSIG